VTLGLTGDVAARCREMRARQRLREITARPSEDRAAVEPDTADQVMCTYRPNAYARRSPLGAANPGAVPRGQENPCQPCADAPGFKARTPAPPVPSPPARRSPVAPDTRAVAVFAQRLGGLPADAPASPRPHAPPSAGLRPLPRARDAPTPPRGGDPPPGPGGL